MLIAVRGNTHNRVGRKLENLTSIVEAKIKKQLNGRGLSTIVARSHISKPVAY